jgi:ubiquinone/menaquinone biosynthesis C-methylase UbiE
MFGPVHDAALDACEAAGGAPRDLLDVGCGTGRLLERASLRWPGARLTGVDLSRPMLDQARAKYGGDSRFAFHQGDSASLPVESASFDAAFSTVSFHHWRDQAGGLREAARVLRPGGVFLLADMNVPLGSLFGFLLHRVDGSRFRGPGELRGLLESAGFRVESLRRFWALAPVQLFTVRKA